MTSRTKVIAGVAILLVLAMVAGLALRERRWFEACRAVPDAEQAKYGAALESFVQANKALSSRNYSTANDLLDLAASKLGNAYWTADLVDDTGMALEAGRAEAARSDFQLAARIKQSAVNSRLSMFRSRLQRSARCHGILSKIGLG